MSIWPVIKKRVQKFKFIRVGKTIFGGVRKIKIKLSRGKPSNREQIKTLSVILSNHVKFYPTPTNITYNWSFGSLLGIFFALQIVTGVILAMHYTANVDLAFASVEHIMLDVKGGYIFRNAHANGASLIFILLYLHLGRGLYYMSYVKKPYLWWTGLVIFLLMMATAFIGYVLPWGQMSFWGATVITSLVTAIPLIGEDIAYWIWGGFAVNNATLTRFFSLHYLLPFIITSIIGLHLILLHTSGSSEPMQINNANDKIKFDPYFRYKDMFICSALFIFFIILVFFYPNILGHADNFIPANILVTPAHIVPEWYFTPFYAILRACPNKIGGAISMLASILILFLLPLIHRALSYNKQAIAIHSDIHKIWFWLFVGIFGMLMFLGSNAAAAPFIVLSKIFAVLYFLHFLLFLPLIIILS